MPLEQRFSAEPTTTKITGVAVVMEHHGMFTEGSFCVEDDTTAFQHPSTGLVHCQHMAFEVISAICGVPTV